MEKSAALAVSARSRSASINEEAPLLRPSRRRPRYFIKAVVKLKFEASLRMDSYCPRRNTIPFRDPLCLPNSSVGIPLTTT